jgi:hypothetical protein
MEITVALDGEKKRDLRFFAGDDMSLTIVVYDHDGDVSPIVVSNVRFAAADGSLPMDSEFVVPSNFFGRVPYRIVGEVEDITTTLAYGVMQTEGGWPSLFCWCSGSPWPYGIVGKADNITVLDAHANFDGTVSVEGALEELGDFKKSVGDIGAAVETATEAAESASEDAAYVAAQLPNLLTKPEAAATDGTTLFGFQRTAISGTIPVDLYDWMNSAPLRDVECGCVGDNVADDTLALNVLTAAGKASGRKVVGRVGATYKITDTVHINCNADFGGSTFATTTALATVAVKTSGTVAGAQLSKLDIRYPTLYTNKANGVAPTAGSIGIQIESARNCRMEFNSVLGFEENLQLYSSDGTTGYVSYLNLYFNEVFYGSKINIHLKTESTGWVNQCTFFGGQFAQINADTAAFNTTNVKITKVDNVGNNPPNGHTFVGPSMEGAFTRTIQYSLPVGFVTSYFSCNTWVNARFEDAANMEFSALALYDLFVGCRSANSATYVGNVYPNVDGSTRLYRHTTDVSAIPGVAGFRTAPSIPIFQANNTGTAAAFSVGTNNRINAAIIANGDFAVFNPGNDTSLYPMASLRVTGGLPRLEMGAGVAAPTTYITWSNDFRVQGHWNPNADVTYNLGSASLRYTNVYASNFRPGAGTATWTSGTGTPEGAVTAAVGSMFTRTDGGASTTLYVKESGAGNTGWVAK